MNNQDFVCFFCLCSDAPCVAVLVGLHIHASVLGIEVARSVGSFAIFVYLEVNVCTRNIIGVAIETSRCPVPVSYKFCLYSCFRYVLFRFILPYYFTAVTALLYHKMDLLILPTMLFDPKSAAEIND